MKQGKIEVNSQNLMPIIKKWLYSDKDIFLREIVSNAQDAIEKHKKLVSIGQAEESKEPYRIIVRTDKENNTVSVEDNGIGMTADEVEKFITKVAYSGATEFMEKYTKTNGDGIIGHFGLGFYSAYMVAKTVTIETLSYEGGNAVVWESDGNEDYTLDDGQRKKRGTVVTLRLFEEEKEFSDEFNVRMLLKKYCSFLPTQIYLNPSEEQLSKLDDEALNISISDNDNVNIDNKGDENNKEEPIKPINNTAPLYLKNPKECTDEEYKEFYKQTFNDYNEPLLWVHLNVDFPFKLKGILYFPRYNNINLVQGEVKLYCNQVFVADNIKEIIPEFLMLLKGIVDIPDIPLNVSRSFLQNDREVQKIKKHITKKVADKINSLFNNDRDKLSGIWKDVSPFLKFGALKDEEFFEQIKDSFIFEDFNGKYSTLKEFNGAKGDIYYCSDRNSQVQYVSLFKEKGLNGLYLEHYIDPHFISFLEYKYNGDVKFKRIDSELPKEFLGEDKEIDKDKIIELFKKVLPEGTVSVEITSLASEDIPAILTLTEESRRSVEMMKMYGMDEVSAGIKEQYVLKVNSSCKTVAELTETDEDKAKYIYMLSLIALRPLNSEEMKSFLDLSYTVLKNS